MKYKKIKRLLAILLAGTLTFTAVPVKELPVQAEEILNEKSEAVEEEAFSGTWAELHAILAERLEGHLLWGT